jgi:BirA family biotin operon repressor/biotin-[acetyl-CoA-carboxylase] ligase
MTTADEDAAFDVERLLRDTFVAHIESHEEVASTNDLALARVADADPPCPLLIVARRQTAGRGRGSNTWFAAGGALTFSLVLETEALALPQAAWPQASLVTGLAVYETVRELLPGEPVGLKWPNDVFLRQRKLCGVLVETSRGPKPRLIVGVGLNVNNPFDAAPSEVRRRAVSLSEVASQRFDLTDVLVGVLGAFARCYGDVASGDSDLPRRWAAACMLRGRRVTLKVGSRAIEGTCRGIDPEGALVVASPAGEERFFGGTVEQFSDPLP